MRVAQNHGDGYVGMDYESMPEVVSAVGTSVHALFSRADATFAKITGEGEGAILRLQYLAQN